MSFILAMAMCLSLSTTALALEKPYVDSAPSVEVVNLSENITDQELQEIVSSTCAYTIQDDGTTVPIDSVITIKDISLDHCAERMFSNQKAYEVTLSATVSNEKNVYDDGEKNTSNVQATAELRMTWIDNFGPSNAIKSVYGSRTVTKGTVTSAVVGWKEFSTPREMVKKDVTHYSAFHYDCENFVCIKPTAFYEIHFAGEAWPIYLQVTSSVLQ